MIYHLTRGLEEYECEVDYTINMWAEVVNVDVYIEAPPWAKHGYKYGCINMALTEKEKQAVYEYIMDYEQDRACD